MENQTSKINYLMLLLLLQFAFFWEQTAMKTLYNGQQHEVPIDVSNGIHRANCGSLWDPSLHDQETGLLLLELKLVSCSGLLHFFVLGAVCRGRQRGWQHLERFLSSSSSGIFLSCLFLDELLLYELHIIVCRCLSLELLIYYLKLSPFLHMSDSTCFLQVSVLCVCQYWDVSSLQVLIEAIFYTHQRSYPLYIIMCCCSFFSLTAWALPIWFQRQCNQHILPYWPVGLRRTGPITHVLLA